MDAWPTSVLLALLGLPAVLLTFAVGRRTARSQETAAVAATESAKAAGEKAAADVMEATTHRFEAMFRTAEALAAAASARADKAQADLAALHLSQKEAMVTVNVKLAECEALNAALVDRFEDMERQQSHTSGRVDELSREHAGE